MHGGLHNVCGYPDHDSARFLTAGYRIYTGASLQKTDGMRENGRVREGEREMNVGEYVRIRSNGKIVKIVATDNDGVVIETGGEDSRARYLKESLDLIPAKKLEPDRIQKFVRFELSYDELTSGALPADNVTADEPYVMTVEDMLAALENIRNSKMDGADIYDVWYEPIDESLSDIIRIEDDESEKNSIPGFWTKHDMLDGILFDISYELFEDGIDFETHFRTIREFEENAKIPVLERPYPDNVKIDYIMCWSETRLPQASVLELALYKKFVNELCDQGNFFGLRAKAYSCYGGNEAFECDWNVSRDCLERLTQIIDEPSFCNSLGYIYYYGRCNDGVPEYDKAFKYFSMGAAGGIYESIYKLSDMYRNGYFVPKSDVLAARLIWSIYDESLDAFLRGERGNKFADVALRAGNLYKDGIDVCEDPDEAYHYYLQAEYAINMRMAEDMEYGDTKVAENIAKAIEEILPRTSYHTAADHITYNNTYEIGSLISNGFQGNHKMQFRIDEEADGTKTITFSVIQRGNESEIPKFLITIPEAHFCGLVETFTFKLSDIDDFSSNYGDGYTTFDSIIGQDFMDYGRTAASITAKYTVEMNP